MDYDPWGVLNIFIESFQPLKELDGFQVDSCVACAAPTASHPGAGGVDLIEP
jgi:hypothetical protein